LEYGVVFVTCAKRQSKEIAHKIVQEKLAACVNIIPEITSIYTWEGKLEEDNENLLIIKTRADLFEQLKERIKSMHSYEVPEIIFLPIKMGYEQYLDWIKESTS